jgi:hypothetical protein
MIVKKHLTRHRTSYCRYVNTSFASTHSLGLFQDIIKNSQNHSIAYTVVIPQMALTDRPSNFAHKE